MGKMKDSSLLKWTQNNKNIMSGSKESKKKSKEEKNKNWLHQPERLTSGHIAYLVKVSHNCIIFKKISFSIYMFSFLDQQKLTSPRVLTW